MSKSSLSRAGSIPNLSEHERGVAALYGDAADKWLAFCERIGQRPYSAWGFWPAPVATMDQAFDEMNRAVIELGRIGPTDRVLDIGCGIGIGCLDLHLQVGCLVVGIDIASAMLRCGRELIGRAGREGAVRLIEMSAVEMNFPPASFDVVVVIDSAPAIETRALLLEKVAQVLAPGGRLVLLDVVGGEGRRSWVRRRLEGMIMSSWGIVEENRVDAAGLRALLEAKQLTVDRIEPVGSRMLPGAVARMSEPEYRQAYRAVFGIVHATVWQVMIRVLRWMNRRKYFDYVLVGAHRA